MEKHINSMADTVGKLAAIGKEFDQDIFIAASVSILSQYNVGATKSDWNEAKKDHFISQRNKRIKA